MITSRSKKQSIAASKEIKEIELETLINYPPIPLFTLKEFKVHVSLKKYNEDAGGMLATSADFNMTLFQRAPSYYGHDLSFTGYVHKKRAELLYLLYQLGVALVRAGYAYYYTDYCEENLFSKNNSELIKLMDIDIHRDSKELEERTMYHAKEKINIDTLKANHKRLMKKYHDFPTPLSQTCYILRIGLDHVSPDFLLEFIQQARSCMTTGGLPFIFPNQATLTIDASIAIVQGYISGQNKFIKSNYVKEITQKMPKNKSVLVAQMKTKNSVFSEKDFDYFFTQATLIEKWHSVPLLSEDKSLHKSSFNLFKKSSDEIEKLPTDALSITLS